ncbi:uncharacterized protein LOC130591083 [Beta vulgaris subsp. vulgaris]|uniref:uncharacterized protein LOC130591083 n=1 Tax=Beta vulgaris subsp. vulgaris TaxID=3555 RepID=UPI002547BD04|nr:uncharacterized protein LOC130591083 [Beta vulgaris subsp. vulgaris]
MTDDNEAGHSRPNRGRWKVIEDCSMITLLINQSIQLVYFFEDFECSDMSFFGLWIVSLQVMYGSLKKEMLRDNFKEESGVATLVLEAVADRDLWIWHSFFGIPGSCNDLNVLHRSPVFRDVLEGRAPPVQFTVNGNQYDKGYYLTDGIYPNWATFIQSVTCPHTLKDKLFAQHQEGARKDVERAFGVLQSRFAIVRKPSLAWDEEILNDIICLHYHAQHDCGRCTRYICRLRRYYRIQYQHK